MRRLSFLFGSLCACCFACSSTTSPPSQAEQQGTSNAGNGSVAAANVIDVDSSEAGSTTELGAAGQGEAGQADVGSDELTSISVAPLPLIPAFSGSITDYYVRCAAGANSLTLTTSRASGETSHELSLLPDEAVAVDDRYWIRCLPPDFPSLTVTRRGTPTPGYYLASSSDYGIVFDTQGVPVWYARGSGALDVDSPAVDTISLMLNSDAADGSPSSFQVRNLSTGATTVVTAAGGGSADGHELQTLPNGDRLIFATPVRSGFDLRGLQSFGANSSILDCQIQELDSAGNLVWSWNASDHIDPVQESLEPAGETSYVDVYHCNAIEPDASGNLLISLRHANALFYIDRASGRILWKLGGTAYNKDGAALIRVENDALTTFSMQHDARFRANGNVTLFDDHGASAGVARGVEYAIDHELGVATPVFQFLGSAPSQYEGSFRRYADGESVIGWGKVEGDTRFLTELDAAGNDVFDIAFDDAEVTYRAIKVPLAQLDLAKLRATTAQ